MSPPDDPPNVSHNGAAESWDDDFEFPSNAPSPDGSPDLPTATTSHTPPAPPPPREESWDDAYAYEEEDERTHATPPPPSRPNTDDDLGSWGSGSDWSGDGDAEDHSHESYTRASSEPPEPRGPPSPSHTAHTAPRFPTLSHSPFAPLPRSMLPTPRSPIAASFFSRMSPKKWRAREADVAPKPDVSPCAAKAGAETTAGSKQVQTSGPRWPRRRGSTRPADVGGSRRRDASPVTRLFPSSSPRQSKPPAPIFANAVHPPSQALPPSPLTPDLTFSPSSPRSAASKSPPPLRPNLPVFPSKPGLSPTPAAPAHPRTLAPAASVPLVCASAHNLPLPPADTEQQHHLATRRSSLGDLQRPLHHPLQRPLQLKIPDRISRVQRDIKRDIGDVREFAECVDQLKNLQRIYETLLGDLRASFLESDAETTTSPSLSPSSPSAPHTPPSPRTQRPLFSPKKHCSTIPVLASSPTKPIRRKFSLAAPARPTPSAYARALDWLDATYGIWWECAELLVELGGRNGDGGEGEREGGARDESGGAVPGLGLAAGMTIGRRPRAVTLGSDMAVAPLRRRSMSTGPPPPSPPRPAQWRATTGRAGCGDLSPRQLMLLRGMLDVEAGKGWDPRGVGGGVRGDEGGIGVRDGSVREKGRGGGLGLRELWRGLRKGTGGARGRNGGGGAEAAPRGSSSGDSSVSMTDARAGASRHSKRTVTAAESAVVSRRKLPTRRPSLAGIFGLGQKSPKHDASTTAGTDESSDWDAEADVDGAARTIRGTKRVKSDDSLAASNTVRVRTRRDPPSSPEKQVQTKKQKPSLQAPRSPRLFFSFSDGPRSAPSSASPATAEKHRVPPRAHLALKPENIRLLLGHARDVSARLNECIGEVRGMMGGIAVVA